MVIARLRRRRRPKRVYRPPEVKLTFSDFIDIAAMTYFGKWAEGLVKAFELNQALRRAGLPYYPTMYAARTLLFTFVSFVVALYFSVIILLSILPLIVKLLLVLFLMIIPVMGFAYFLAYPSAKASERKNGVESELPFFAAYLATMARGGASISQVLERVAKLKVFKAMRREASMVIRDVNMFGKDPMEALEANALDHPSHLYRDFILGYVTTVRTGGDVLHYLEIRTQDVFNRRMADLKLIAERMSMFTEMYITVAVIMTLVFYVFFTISAIFPAGKFAGIAGLLLFSFAVLPTLNLLILYMIHASQPKSPISFKTPYRAFIFVGIPLALAAFPIMFYLTGAYHVFERVDKGVIMGLDVTLAATLVAMSLPPAYEHVKENRKLKGLSRATAAFLRDLAEIRKTGLSPERSIISVVQERSYGPLDRIVKRLATALIMGLDVEQALRRVLRGVKSWILLANMRFLSDSIMVGGGSPETLDALARYAYNLVELEEELRKRLRPYIAMPYMGAILVSAASLLVLGFTVKGLGLAPQTGAAGFGAFGGLGGGVSPQEVANVALYLSIGAIFNSWLMGLVAGKIQDTRLSAGFLHATILTIISLIVSLVTLRPIELAA